jgi:hypothetical protein
MELVQTLASHWCRRPGVLGHAPDALASLTDIAAGLCELAQRGERPRIYVDGQAVAATAADACQASDGSIATYIARLVRDHSANEIACIVKDLETSHANIWYGCGRLLRALYTATGIPDGDASLMLFAGRYGKTPFGCHKDTCDVITYVIAGRKRYLVWPFEIIAQHLGLDESMRAHSLALDAWDYNALRDQATVIEGGPGDLLYWPWDHWHVAESTGELTASLSLGIERFGAAQPGDVDTAMARATRFAFGTVLPEVEGPPFASEDRLVPAMPELIAWYEQRDQLVVAAGGRIFTVDRRPGLADMFAELARGEPVQVRDLEARYCAHQLLDRDELEEILDCLRRFGAFAHEPALVVPGGAEVFSDPTWFPLRLANYGAMIDFAPVAEHEHRELDGAVVFPRRARVASLLDLHNRCAPVARRPRYLFTAGYCGSTLISRCLEAIEHCSTINEPTVLDHWAWRHGELPERERAEWRRVLAVVTGLLFRSDDPAANVIVKGGEGATGIMEELFQTDERATGVLLYSRLPVFLANTLKTERRRAEFRRVVRSPQHALVSRRLGMPAPDPAVLSDAEAIAQVWLLDRALYNELRRCQPATMFRALEFDAFLDAPTHGMRALADHFSLDLRAGREHAIAAGDRFGRHAKQDVSFDKHARRDRTATLHAHYRDEIEVALAYCERVWGCDPCQRLAGDLLEPSILPHHGPGMQEASDDLW